MTIIRILTTTAVFGLMVACDKPLDFDLRDLVKEFDTSQSIETLSVRPSADKRGVISYPNYQVVVAQENDTMAIIANRLSLDASQLADFNGVGPNVILRRGELVALPRRVAVQTDTTQSSPIRSPSIDVTAIATTALDRAGPQVVSPVTPNVATIAQTDSEPVRHKVSRGETVFSISRFYGVPVREIAKWNGLGPELKVREGQFLLIPQEGQSAPMAPVVAQAPGTGSETPVPPSAVLPLPDEMPSVALPASTVPQAPNLGTPMPAVSTAQFSYPVEGNIIRAYASGRNEGIDISVAAGTSVKAAGTGSVAAVTTDTTGVAIIVIKHDDGLLTVYTNLEELTVAKGANVRKGQIIGKVRAGDPSYLHFEVRRGLTSVDPADFLP